MTANCISSMVYKIINMILAEIWFLNVHWIFKCFMLSAANNSLHKKIFFIAILISCILSEQTCCNTFLGCDLPGKIHWNKLQKCHSSWFSDHLKHVRYVYEQVWRLCTEWQRVVDLNGVVNDRGRNGWTPTTELSDCLPNCQPQVRYPEQIKCHNNAALFSNSRQCIWTVLSKTITTTAAMEVAMSEANQVSHSLLSSLFKKHLLSQEIIQTGKHMKKLVAVLSSWNMNNKEMLSFQFHMDHHSMSLSHSAAM